MRSEAKKLVVILLVIVTTLSSTIVLADPSGPDGIARGDSERGPSADPIEVEAQAGNVTALTINATRITKRWQGYYGNITGTITLDDADNNTLYDWKMASPEGEIYAVNASAVSWPDVFCFNFSNNKSQGQSNLQKFNGTDLEGSLGIGPTDGDGVDETFNRTFTGTFQVGSKTINSESGCSLVSLNVNDVADELNFNETILTDNNSVIYTTLLEQDKTGFQGSTLDFQMIVGENGDVSGPSTYYFYVELT